MAVYIIQRGDNLTRIAKAHCTDVKTLLELNPQIKNKNLIFANDTLKLPDAKMDTFIRKESGEHGAVKEQTGSENFETQAAETAIAADDAVLEEKTVGEQLVYDTTGRQSQQQAANPFWYAAGGAATGVIGMKLGEKAAPSVKKGVVSAAKVTKTATTKAARAVSSAAKSTATATKSAASKAFAASKSGLTKLSLDGQALVSSGKAKITQGAAKLSGKVSAAKVSATKAAKAVGNTAAKGGKAALAATGKAAPTIMKAAGKVAKPVAVVYGALEVADAYETGGTKAAVKKGATVTSAAGSAWAGAKLGAIAGGSIGSAVPVVGTAAGALIGGVIGSIAGWFAGEKIAEKVLA